jgi:hypothetical protein
MNIDIFDLIAFSVSFAIIVALVFLLVRSGIKRSNISKDLVQTVIIVNALREKLSKEMSRKEENDLQQTEGFLKFISDSRDWAFQYIEEVQEALKNFDLEMDPIIEWSKTYGIVNGDNAHTEALDKISLAYGKLKSVLPEENKTPNN